MRVDLFPYHCVILNNTFDNDQLLITKAFGSLNCYFIVHYYYYT